MAKKNKAAVVEAETDQFQEFLTQLRDLIDQYSGDADGEKAEDGGAGREVRRAELEKMTDRALRTILKDMGFDPDQIKKEKDREVLIGNILDEEFPEDDEEDEDESSEEDDDEDEDEEDEDEDEEDGEEEEELSRDDLMNMNLRELKKLALESYGVDKADLKGQDKDSIVDMILAGGEEEDDEEEDDDDDDEDYYTREDYEAMGIKELRAVAKESGVKFKPADSKSTLIDKLLAE